MTRELNLFAHQKSIIDELRDLYREGRRRAIIALATGGGKTEVAIGIVLASRGKLKPGLKAYFIADRKTLIWQTVERAEAYGLRCGVIQAENTIRYQDEDLVVASVDSLRTRCPGGIPDDAGLIIFDEAHIVKAPHRAMLEKLDNIPIYGLTATPLRTGLGKLYQGLVRGPTIRWLTDNGYLVPAKVYQAVAADLSGVGMGTSGGEITHVEIRKDADVIKIESKKYDDDDDDDD